MRLRKVRFPSDSRVEWHIDGKMNNGTSSQDDNGDEYIDEALEAKIKEEAIALFDAKVEELKQKKYTNGGTYYEYIEVSLKMVTRSTTRIIKRVSLRFETHVREKTITLRAGRGWIENKKWLNLEGSAKLNNGSIRTKQVRSES